MKTKLMNLIVFLPLLLLLAACSNEGDSDFSDGDAEREGGDLNALIDSGKEHLTHGEYSAAADDFEAALDIAPDNAQATFGHCLAGFQELNAYLDNTLRMLESLGGTTATDGDSDTGDESAEAQQAKLMAEYFVLSDLRESGLMQLERLNSLKDVPEDFLFSLEAFPLTLSGDVVINLHSEWDRADVYALAGLQYFIMALLDLLISQSVDDALSRISVVGNAVKSGDDIYTALARLLDKFDFLAALHPYKGAELWREAFEFAAAGADDMLAANRLMRAEKDDQTDDVFVQNSSVSTRKVRQFAIQGDFPLKPGVTSVQLLWDGEKLSLEGTLERLSAHLKGDAQLRMRFEEDVLTIVGVALDFVRKAIGIENLLGIFGLELDQKTLDLLNNVGDNSGEEFPRMLISLLPLFGIPGDMLQLDLYTFASRPMGLRDMLPNRGVDPVSGAPVLLMSFECARIAYARLDFTPGQDAVVFVSDPGPAANKNPGAGNDSVKITVKSGIIDENEDFVISDRETLNAAERDDVEGLFEAAIRNVTGGEATQGDGKITLPEGGEIRSYYTDAGSADDPITVMAKIRDGQSRRTFRYSLECAADSARDYAHFDSPQFAQSIIYPDPPAEAVPATHYPPAAADGEKQTLGYGAFASPTLNGMIWLKMSSLAGSDCTDYGFEADYAPADTRGINLFIHKIIQVINEL